MNTFFYFLFAAGISLQSVALTSGFLIYLSDLFIIFFVIYAILFVQKVSLNSLSLAVILLAIYILFANLLNYYLFEDFSFTGFITNYLKIVAIFLMVIFAPSFIKVLDLEKFFKALKIILLFHCILIILDPFVIYPWGFGRDGISLGASGEVQSMVARARGLFEEPSAFALYAGLTLVLIMQYDFLFKSKILNYFDYVIIFSGLIASTSLAGVVIVLMALARLIYLNRSIFSSSGIGLRSVLITIPITLVGIPLSIIILFNSLSYFSERIYDSGNLLRFFGKAMAVAEITQDRPLIGTGMGGANNPLSGDKNLNEGVEIYLFDADQFTEFSGSYVFGLVSAGGIIALSIFYLMIFGMIYKPETRFLGIIILALGLTKGGVFDLYLWLVITIAFAIVYIYKEEGKIISQVNYKK